MMTATPCTMVKRAKRGAKRDLAAIGCDGELTLGTGCAKVIGLQWSYAKFKLTSGTHPRLRMSLKQTVA